MSLSLILLCGIPASGKTTLMEALISFWRKTKGIPTASPSYLCPINFDHFIPLSIQKELIQVEGQWKECRKDLRTAVDAYILLLKDGIYPSSLTPRQAKYFDILYNGNPKPQDEQAKVIFLVEDNFYYLSMRQEWYNLALKYGMGYYQVYIDCPIDEAHKRNATRIEKIPPNVLSRMAERSQPPEKDDPHTLILLASENLETKLEKVIQAISISLQYPLQRIKDNSEEKEASRIICSQNVVHQADIILRKLTGKRIQNLENKSQDKVKKINTVRHIVLRNLRSGLLKLPAELCSSIEQGSPSLEWLEKEMSLAFDHQLHFGPSTVHNF